MLLAYQGIKGVASIIGPLASAALLTTGQKEQHQPKGMGTPDNPPHRTHFGSYGYDALIVFVSVCMGVVSFLGAILFFVRRHAFRNTGRAAMKEGI